MDLPVNLFKMRIRIMVPVVVCVLAAANAQAQPDPVQDWSQLEIALEALEAAPALCESGSDPLEITPEQALETVRTGMTGSAVVACIKPCCASADTLIE